MADAGEPGTLSEDNVLPEDPVQVAEQIANTDSLPADAGPTNREDHVQNAINFLSHPKVRSSSKESKVSFLEKKGLTAAEIEEAFKRAPEAMAGSGNALATAQERPPLQKPFPTAAPSPSPSPYAGATSMQQAQQPPALRWTQVVVGASVVAVGVYAVKQMVGPYATKLYRRLYGISDPAALEKAEEKRVADVVAGAIQLQTNELRAAIESLREMIQQLDKGKEPTPAEPGITRADLQRELRGFADTLEKRKPQEVGADEELGRELREIKSLITQKSTERTANQGQAGPHYPSQHHQSPNGFLSVTPPASRAAHRQESPRQDKSPPLPPGPAPSPSYMEVLEMLERGETPPNIRTDINDQPPNPTVAPPSTQMQPKSKPWEKRKPSRPNSAQAVNGADETASHTVITDITDQPGSSKTADAWRPPPIPQASLRKSLPASSASSVVGDEDT